MSIIVVNGRHPRQPLRMSPGQGATSLQRALIYGAVIAAFAMVIGVSLGIGHVQPTSLLASGM